MLCFIGHALTENRHGLVVQGDLTRADGHAERRAALDLIHRHSPGSTRRPTLGAKKGFDAVEFVTDLRKACVTSPIAQKTRYSAMDGRTSRHAGLALSLRNRKRIEEAVGLAWTVYRGVERIRSRFILTMAATTSPGCHVCSPHEAESPHRGAHTPRRWARRSSAPLQAEGNRPAAKTISAAC